MKPSLAQLHTRTPREPVIPEDQPYPDSPTGPASSNDSQPRGLFRFRRHTPHNWNRYPIVQNIKEKKTHKKKLELL